MDDYKTLVEDATRAVVKEGLGGAVWVHRLADAVEDLLAMEQRLTDHIVQLAAERDALQRQLDADNFDSLRSRIAALEAVIQQMRDALTALRENSIKGGWAFRSAESILRGLMAAPSAVLDQVIREAKAEAVEAARDAIMPPVNWNLRPDGTEMPGTQHIDEALHDIHVQLSAVAAEYRNEER